MKAWVLYNEETNEYVRNIVGPKYGGNKDLKFTLHLDEARIYITKAAVENSRGYWSGYHYIRKRYPLTVKEVDVKIKLA